MNVIKKTVELPDGRTISIETGKLAKQADGAVMLTMGNTMLLATVCAAKDAVPGTDLCLCRWSIERNSPLPAVSPEVLPSVRVKRLTMRF